MKAIESQGIGNEGQMPCPSRHRGARLGVGLTVTRALEDQQADVQLRQQLFMVDKFETGSGAEPPATTIDDFFDYGRGPMTGIMNVRSGREGFADVP